MNNLVVISSWLDRDPSSLFKLVDQLSNISPGVEYYLCIVCNHSVDKIENNSNENFEKLYDDIRKIINNNNWPPIEFYLVFRENVGMNIGAWDYAWRKFSTFTNYLFLQDEVLVMSDNWLLSYIRSIEEFNIQERTPFLLGESWNSKWEHPWSILIKSNLNSLSYGHSLALGRVDFYLDIFKKWNVKHGQNGGHLRSLVWFTNIFTLNKINGFKIGSSYGECIASEIATSLLVKQNNGIVKQIKTLPFSIFWHQEWKKDGSTKLHS
jgi:hypothetical protein